MFESTQTHQSVVVCRHKKRPTLVAVALQSAHDTKTGHGATTFATHGWLNMEVLK